MGGKFPAGEAGDGGVGGVALAWREIVPPADPAQLGPQPFHGPVAFSGVQCPAYRQISRELISSIVLSAAFCLYIFFAKETPSLYVHEPWQDDPALHEHRNSIRR